MRYPTGTAATLGARVYFFREIEREIRGGAASASRCGSAADLSLNLAKKITSCTQGTLPQVLNKFCQQNIQAQTCNFETKISSTTDLK